MWLGVSVFLDCKNEDRDMVNNQSDPKGTVFATEVFSVNANFANIRIKGIDRSKIPCSFKVHLLKNNQVIASRVFFQGTNVDFPENISGPKLVHFDFELPITLVSDGVFGFWVEPVDHGLFGDHFPHGLVGNPTVNIRLLVRAEQSG